MVKSKESLAQTSKPAAKSRHQGIAQSSSHPYAKDISEHVSSVGRFYADFDEFDLSELAPPAGPKQHWWDKDYSPDFADGHKPKICSLSELTAETTQHRAHGQPNLSITQPHAQARQQKSQNSAHSHKSSLFNSQSLETQADLSSADSSSQQEEASPQALHPEFDESQLTPLATFNPVAYRQRKQHQHLRRYNGQDISLDLKSARDLVNQESYQERLRKHWQQKYGATLDKQAPLTKTSYEQTATTTTSSAAAPATATTAQDYSADTALDLEQYTVQAIFKGAAHQKFCASFDHVASSDLATPEQNACLKDTPQVEQLETEVQAQCQNQTQDQPTAAGIFPTTSSDLTCTTVQGQSHLPPSHYAQEVALHHRLTQSQTHEDNLPQSAKLSYAQTVAKQRACNQERQEQQAEQRAQAAITPWNTRGDKWLRSKQASSPQTRLLQRHGGLATQEVNSKLTLEATGQATIKAHTSLPQSVLSMEQSGHNAGKNIEQNSECRLNAPLQVDATSLPSTLAQAHGKNKCATQLSSEGVEASAHVVPTMEATTVKTALHTAQATGNARIGAGIAQGKVPYRNYFAQQNVFGTSSAESNADEEHNYSSSFRRNSTFKSRSRRMEKSNSGGAGNYVAGSSGVSKRRTKYSLPVIDYDDVSCKVSGIGMVSSSKYAEAYDIEESTASFGSYGAQESNSTHKGYKNSKRRYGKYGKGQSYGQAHSAEADAIPQQQGEIDMAEQVDSQYAEHTALEPSAHLGAGADTLKTSAARAQVADKAKQSEPVQAYNYMIQLLTRREYSQAEIRQKVKGRFSEEAINTALQRCVEYGYQSDTRHAEMLIRHMEFSGYGPQKLWLEARRKGADTEEIKRLSSEVDWDDIAYQAVCRKFTAEQVSDYATRNKALAFLARRGFSSASSYAALERLQKDVEND